jgi:hypothetical protein
VRKVGDRVETNRMAANVIDIYWRATASAASMNTVVCSLTAPAACRTAHPGCVRRRRRPDGLMTKRNGLLSSNSAGMVPAA